MVDEWNCGMLQAFSTTQPPPLWNPAEAEKSDPTSLGTSSHHLWFCHHGRFLVEMSEGFFFWKSWVNDQSFCGRNGAIVVCCQTSWFCTQQLPHHLSLCILLISREHHSVASIPLPAFSSLPHSLWHPRLFFHCFPFMCGPLLTSGSLVFHAVPLLCVQLL